MRVMTSATITPSSFTMLVNRSPALKAGKLEPVRQSDTEVTYALNVKGATPMRVILRSDGTWMADITVDVGTLE